MAMLCRYVHTCFDVRVGVLVIVQLMLPLTLLRSCDGLDATACAPNDYPLVGLQPYLALAVSL